LIDSLSSKVFNAGKLFAKKYGVDSALVREAYRQHSGIPRRQLFNAICRELSLPELTDTAFEAMSRDFTRRNREQISKIEVPEDTNKALETLKLLHVKLFVSTASAQDEVAFLSQKLGLASRFIEVLGSKDGFTKGPIHIAYILEKYGEKNSKVLFVGDEPNDILLGKAAGVLTAVRLGSHDEKTLLAFEPDYLLNCLMDIPAILETGAQA